VAAVNRRLDRARGIAIPDGGHRRDARPGQRLRHGHERRVQAVDGQSGRDRNDMPGFHLDRLATQGVDDARPTAIELGDVAVGDIVTYSNIAEFDGRRAMAIDSRVLVVQADGIAAGVTRVTGVPEATHRSARTPPM
jgi:hypothetical protein